VARRFVSALAVCLCLSASAWAQDKVFDSDGVKIHYLVRGEGEPVLLIHGFAASAQTNWVLPGIVRGLAADYQVIALDCRGHGKSDKPHDPKQYGAAMAEDAVRLLDHLKIKKAHVVGYSMGGGIAFHLVAAHPDRVRSVVLAGWGLSPPDDKGTLFKELAESLDAGKGIGPLILALTPAGKPRPTEGEIEAVNKILLATNDPKALAAVVHGFANPDVPAQADTLKKLKNSRVPTLALVGEIDPFRAGARALKKQAPDVELVTVAGGDHITTVVRPEFLTALRDFLGKQRETDKGARP
jgi:pimeloyl-ACP methyl ester carboxylesterase